MSYSTEPNHLEFFLIFIVRGQLLTVRFCFFQWGGLTSYGEVPRYVNAMPASGCGMVGVASRGVPSSLYCFRLPTRSVTELELLRPETH
jgi:hypothetical protein